MNELYLMVTITERGSAKRFLELFGRHNVTVTLSALGAGTARSELLDYLGLEKRELADSWLELAASFAKVPVKYEADILKQQQKQEQSMLKQEMG